MTTPRCRPIQTRTRRGVLLGLSAFGLLAARRAEAAGPGAITVFAAASLGTILDTLGARFTRATGHRVTIAPAGSPVLARQIQQGAPADLFISASPDWMDVLARDGLIRPETRVDVVSNRLVMIAPKTRARTLDLTDRWAVEDALGTGRLAMALVEAVPAGIYGRAALGHFDLWEPLEGRIAQTDNVRAALALVAAGAAPLGLVYASDAVAEPRVRVVAEIPPESHPTILYPAAVLTHAAEPGIAAQFLHFISSPPARDRFRQAGFTLLRPERG